MLNTFILGKNRAKNAAEHLQCSVFPLKSKQTHYVL